MTTLTNANSQLAQDFMAREKADFGSNSFDDIEDFQKFIGKLVSNGIDPVRLRVEFNHGPHGPSEPSADVLWILESEQDGSGLPAFTIGATVAIGGSRPDNCDYVEGQGIRMWWD